MSFVCSNDNHKCTAKQTQKQNIVLHVSDQNAGEAWLFPTFYGKNGLIATSNHQIFKQIIT